MKKIQGVTLIELMIVMAIIGMIVLVATPFYRDYTLRSQITSALSEINKAKIEYEMLLSRSESDDFFTPQNIGLTSSPYCNFEVAAPGDLGGQPRAISCIFREHTDMFGSRINLARSAIGQWSCVVEGDVSSDAKPETCD